MANTDPIALDLSHHNIVDSFHDVAQAGVIAVILKATEGTTHIDDRFASYRDQAVSAGLMVSAYHFLRHGSAREQMLHFLDVVGPRQGERVTIDYERDDCTIDDLKLAVDQLRNCGLNLQITVYGSAKLTEDVERAGNPAWLNGTSLWAARYSSSQPNIASVWPTWSLWQYTDKGSCAGIEGAVDLNRFNGADDNARLWFAPAPSDESVQPPAPAPEQQPIAITAPPGTAFLINGNLITAG
jgi:lysozyme